MRITTRSQLLLLSTCIAPALADYLGPSYPPPRDLTSDKSLVPASWKNVTDTIAKYLSSDGGDPAVAALNASAITFSLGMFSTHDSTAAKELQYHYTSPEIANASNGTNKVDGDSIYHIASVTKLITVLTAFLHLSDADWNKSLVDVFPKLKEYMGKGNDVVNNVQWDKITLSNLAAQISGVPRDGFPYNLGELAYMGLVTGGLLDPGKYDWSNLTALGLPPLEKGDKTAFPACASAEFVLNPANPSCPAEPYLEGVAPEPPVFQPRDNPAYANDGFVLFGIAVAQITGKSWDEMYAKSVFEPLGMSSSNSSVPPVSEWVRSVIVGKPEEGFAFPPGPAVTSGGLLSTTNDLAKLGVGILDSTLIPSEETRAWMKPVAHTARVQYSVGRPWEIIRYTHPTSGRVTDLYTKSGDSGSYSAYMVVIPDYDAGFSVLSAGSAASRLDVVLAISDLVSSTVIPALEAQAAAEAGENYGGTYASTSPKSSITLALNKTADAAPGLHVTAWTSNGTDMLGPNGLLPSIQLTPPYRLVPTIFNGSGSEGGKIAFQLVTSQDAPNDATPLGLFSRNMRGDWISAGVYTYGGLPIQTFVFDVDAEGKPTSLRPSALRVDMKKSD